MKKQAANAPMLAIIHLGLMVEALCIPLWIHTTPAEYRAWILDQLRASHTGFNECGRLCHSLAQWSALEMRAPAIRPPS